MIDKNILNGFKVGWTQPLVMTRSQPPRLECESKVKTTKEQWIGAHSLACGTLGAKGCVGTSGCRLGRVTSIYSHIHAQTKQQVD
jgi:hypothetical protein